MATAGERVFAVDDNPINLHLLKAVLEAKGYQFHAAQNASEALSLLPVLRPRIILMDLQLPGQDGLALTRLLREDPAFADVIITAVTSYAMTGDRERAVAAGCDDYVTQPIDTRALPRLIERHPAD